MTDALIVDGVYSRDSQEKNKTNQSLDFMIKCVTEMESLIKKNFLIIKSGNGYSVAENNNVQVTLREQLEIAH